MFPGVCPGAVGKDIADLVIGKGAAVNGCQQVFPVGIGILIVYRRKTVINIYSAGGISECAAVFNVTGIIVCPYIGITGSLIILPDQLVCLIVLISGCISTVTDR